MYYYWSTSKKRTFLSVSSKVNRNYFKSKNTGILTIKSITDIYYLMRKRLKNENEVREIINKLYNIFFIEDTLSEDGYKALNSKINDYEDAIMIETGKRLRVDYIITRNEKHYKKSEIPIFTPEQFIKNFDQEL